MHAAQHRPQSAADPFNALDVLVPDGMRKRLLARAEPWRLRHAALSARRRLPALRSVCLLVRTIVAEMVMLTGDPGLRGRDRRFALAHIQQISVYVCHVVLQYRPGPRSSDGRRRLRPRRGPAGRRRL